MLVESSSFKVWTFGSENLHFWIREKQTYDSSGLEWRVPMLDMASPLQLSPMILHLPLWPYLPGNPAMVTQLPFVHLQPAVLTQSLPVVRC